jgi:predicted RNA-binding Zn-ribbon protein involved in translation (DUF1610 family)
MSFHTGSAHSLARQVSECLDAKAANGCPLCGEHHSWDFSGVRIVYLVDAQRMGKADRRRTWSGVRTKVDDPLRTLTSGNRLVRLTCDNCGHVLLLDAEKIREIPESNEVEEADF